MRRPLPILLLGCVLAASGCPPAKDHDPLTTALRYLDAASAGDVETCFSLLSEEAQRRCDRACLANILERQRAEFRAARDELRESLAGKNAPGNITQSHRASLRLRDGSELHLVQPATSLPSTTRGAPQDTGYRFAHSPLAFYPQDTPERALRSFLLAIERRRWDVLLSFMPRSLAQPPQGPPYTPDQLRQRFEGPAQKDISRQLTALRQHLGDAVQISENGTEAKLTVGDNKEVRLLYEDEAWRISQLE